jgi:hypothetical protein
LSFLVNSDVQRSLAGLGIAFEEIFLKLRLRLRSKSCVSLFLLLYEKLLQLLPLNILVKICELVIELVLQRLICFKTILFFDL